MPIKWSALKVSEAMDMAEEFVNEAKEPLERALMVAQEAENIDNLPEYMKQRISRLTYEIQGAIGGKGRYHDTDGTFRNVIKSVRDDIPEGAIEAERERTKNGMTSALM